MIIKLNPNTLIQLKKTYRKLFVCCLFLVANIHFAYGQYCTSNSTSASFCSTSLVSVGSLNNASSGCANYSDYTNIYTELSLNSTYNLTIGLENCSGISAPKICNIYIDWNANQSFEPNEEVHHINATTTLAANQPLFNLTLSVPANAVEDTILMRVVTLYTAIDNANDYSCGTYGWGETEDYSLIISGMINGVNISDNPCFGDSIGTIDISTVNTPGSNFAYSIDGGASYSSSSVFPNLPNGSYDVCVVDSSTGQAQCYNNNPVVINSPNALYATTNVIDLSCFNSNDGILNATAYGGQPNYFFEWTNNSSVFIGDSISLLNPGYYDLLITDNNGCKFGVDSLFVKNPSKVVIDSVNTSSVGNYNLSCHNSTDGFVEVFASGGTGGMLVNWNGIVSPQTLYQNLPSGVQEVIVFDDNFCQEDTSIFLTAPERISSSNTVLHVGCENENDGSLTTNILGGVSPFSIGLADSTGTNLFNAVNSQGVEFINSLVVGDYLLSVSDSNNCTYAETVSIENPVFTLTTKDVDCYGTNSGQISYTIDFSVDTFNLISPASVNNLIAGVYSFVIESNQGCKFDSIVTIKEPDEIGVIQSAKIICEDSELSDILVTGYGGVTPYSIYWTTGDTVFNPSYGIGSYSYTFSDANNCLYNGQIEVIPSSIPNLSYSMTEPSCFENFDASIEIFVTDGYPPFKYNWEDGRGEALIDSLPPKTYRLTVTDSAECSSSLLELVVPYVYSDCFYFPDAFTPNGDGINDVYEISSIFSRQPVELSIYDKLGSLIFFSNEDLKWDGTYKNRKCQSGTYYYVLKYANQYTTGDLLLLE